MIGGLILVPIVSLLTQKSCPKDAETMFTCYNKKTVVSAKRALEEDVKIEQYKEVIL